MMQLALGYERASSAALLAFDDPKEHVIINHGQLLSSNKSDVSI